MLSRQWKNVLYTPLLLDHNYKTKHVKPLNVTFALPESDDEIILTDGENSGEENEVTDECAVLINTEAGAILNNIKAQEKAASMSYQFLHWVKGAMAVFGIPTCCQY